MKICKECGGIAEWNSYYGGITCTRCGYVETPPLTNYDLLVSKSPEEMAGWCNSYFTCPPKTTCPKGEVSCEKCWLEYLKRKVKE